MIAASKDLVGYIRRYDLPLVFSTDAFGPPDQMAALQLQEYGARLRAGFSSAEVAVQVTSGTAQLLALSGPRSPYRGTLGVVREGALADFLVVEGNPLEDVTVLERPDETLRLIVKGGAVVKNTLD